MKILSLFDGMSCGQIALKEMNVNIDKYFASEIKPHAIKCTMDNFPNTIQLGDVTKISYKDGFLYTEYKKIFVGDIDLLIGGSPCQDLSSINQKGKGLSGDKSKLFFEYIRILKEVKPRFFLLENVVPRKNIDRDIITKHIGVDPVFINSSLVSAQQRRRYYWTNIKNIKQPKDRNIRLFDILEHNPTNEEKISIKRLAFIEKKRYCGKYVRVNGDKSMPITARGYNAWNTQYIEDEKNVIRCLTIREYARLTNYT